MVDHMIVTWEGKYGNLFCQIRNKAKEGRSLGNGGSRESDLYNYLKGSR